MVSLQNQRIEHLHDVFSPGVYATIIVVLPARLATGCICFWTWLNALLDRQAGHWQLQSPCECSTRTRQLGSIELASAATDRPAACQAADIGRSVRLLRVACQSFRPSSLAISFVSNLIQARPEHPIGRGRQMIRYIGIAIFWISGRWPRWPIASSDAHSAQCVSITARRRRCRRPLDFHELQVGEA